MYPITSLFIAIFRITLVPLNPSHRKVKLLKRAAVVLLVLALLGASTGQVKGQKQARVRAPQTEEEVKRLVEQANKLRSEAKYAEAIPLMEILLTAVEKEGGPQHPVVAQGLNALAELHRLSGDFVKAEPLYRRAIAIQEKLPGPEQSNLAITLNNLALVYVARSDYDQAEPLLQRALTTNEKISTANPSDVASTLNNLGQLYKEKGNYSRAELLFRRSLAISEKALGPEHQSLGFGLNNLAALYEARGDYTQAESLLRRSLSIREKALGPHHPEVAQSLNNVALLLTHKGDYVTAEPLLQRSIAILEKALGPKHASLANPLVNLAELYKGKGDHERAEPLLKRALTITEETLGPEHVDIAQTLNNLADLYMRMELYDRVEPLYQRSLAIAEKVLGVEHPNVARVLNNLASLYELKGDTAGAEALYFRSTRIREKALGPEHPDVGYSLNNLGLLYMAQKRDFVRAEPLIERALAIFEKALGPTHPTVASTVHNLASLFDEKGDLDRAIRLQTRSNDIVDRNLALILTTGSEKQKSLYLDTFSAETNYTVSLSARRLANSPEATRLALTTILRRKGRALDVASDQIGALRQRLNPQDRELFEQLSAARARLATFVLTGPAIANFAEHHAEMTKLKSEVEILESVVSSRSAEFRAQALPVTLERVQKALDTGTALIEFVFYEPYTLEGKIAERVGAPRYVAYVLPQQGQPAWVDLGEAAAIDKGVAELRRALSSPQSDDVKQVARALDQQIMQPVRKLLGETRTLFVAPDGGLNLIPLGALVDEQNRYLVENYSITYLTSGRDLLRLQLKNESRQAPVVIANPQFDLTNHSQPTPAIGKGGGRRSIDFSKVQFSQLKGTAEEALALGTLLPNAKILTEAQATEGALKQLAGPSILHVATHGFFLPDQPQESTADARRVGLAPKATSGKHRENPFLRSGLALAGANKLQGKDGEDGILTALEASGLDLWGTKLVVLSACETGVGEVKNGEGVYGLRRALVLAGAESQVMSLWQVSDEATRELMVAFYERLKAGEGRTAALSAVQLEMLKGDQQTRTGDSRGISQGRTEIKKDRSHPFFWASFIQSGDWRNMAGLGNAK